MRERKYCLSKDNACECGRNGWAVKLCRRPFSDARMREIMNGLGDKLRTGNEVPSRSTEPAKLDGK